jgi:hypothetical protein
VAVQGQDALQVKPIFDHNKQSYSNSWSNFAISALSHQNRKKMITTVMGLSETKSGLDRDELDTLGEQTSKLRHRFPYLWMRK